ncbi:MAG: YheT family hydrolase, partial [Anaerolineae bacterium]
MSNRLPPFTPHPLVRNPHVQTLLGSRLGPPHRSDLEARSQEMVLSLDVDGGVRLQGFYTPRPQNAANGKGLALLLHGWLGSVKSTYMLAVGDDLRRRGYALFRLNMRDHGDTVALNEDMFHGCRLEEVFQAARQVAALEPGSPFYIAGFSMGGNFALRLAWQHSLRPIPTLQGVVAVSPSIRPGKTLAAIDRSLPLYRHYFLLKWRRKLEQKQTAFPHRYDFSDLLTLKSSCAISERVIPRYTGFADT